MNREKKVKIGSHTGCFYKIQNTNIKGEKEEKSRGKKRKGKIRRHTGCLYKIQKEKDWR